MTLFVALGALHGHLAESRVVPCWIDAVGVLVSCSALAAILHYHFSLSPIRSGVRVLFGSLEFGSRYSLPALSDYR